MHRPFGKVPSREGKILLGPLDLHKHKRVPINPTIYIIKRIFRADKIKYKKENEFTYAKNEPLYSDSRVHKIA